ncbi:MAG: ABC transporter permease [Hyphomicrobiales bacterium]|nr:ABC transporter permease [Hyphomicrobiales bacterium]
MLERITLERRANPGTVLSIATYSGALALAIVLSLAVIIAAGVPTGALFEELIVQVFFSPAGLARTLTMATPMMLAALAAALCLRLKFWNIGIEGQLLLGAIFATTVALYDIGGPLRLPLMLIASALGGALWIAAPVLLKLRLGVSEVIVTLLLSNVAFLFLQHLLFGPFGDTSHNFPTSPVFDETEKLVRFGFGDTNLGLVIALIAVAAIAVMIHRLRFGFASRFSGDNARAAQALGFNTNRIMLVSILLGGAMAGLAGGVIVSGTEFRLTQAVGVNMTFNGIVIAALARNEPLWIPLVSFCIAGLNVASATLKVFYGVSEGVVLIIQGIILLTLVTCQFVATYRVSISPAATNRGLV